MAILAEAASVAASIVQEEAPAPASSWATARLALRLQRHPQKRQQQHNSPDRQPESYVPLLGTAEHLRRVVLNGNLERLERLWSSLRSRYSHEALLDCLRVCDAVSRQTLLVAAAEQGLVEMTRWLLDRGVEDEGMTKTLEGDTILHIAARRDCPEIIALYHSRFADVYSDQDAEVCLKDWPGRGGASPLCVACRHNAESSVNLLLNLGASVGHIDHNGNTPLHYCSMYGHIDLVRLLIHRGANAFAKNNHGFTPSDYAYSYAVEQEIQNTVRSALEAGKRARKLKSSASLRNHASRSPLHLTNASSLRVDAEVEEFAEDEDTLGGLGYSPLTPRGLGISMAPENVNATPPSLQQPLKIQTTGSSSPQTPKALPTAKLGASFTSSTIPAAKAGTNAGFDDDIWKALQRILTRDQNAQADFQASAAFRAFQSVNITRSATISTSRFQTSTTAGASSDAMRRQGTASTASTQLTYASTASTASSAEEPQSPSEAAELSQTAKGAAYFASSLAGTATITCSPLTLQLPPLPGTPTTASISIPNTQSSSASSTVPMNSSGSTAAVRSGAAAFVSRLKRSESSSQPPAVNPGGTRAGVREGGSLGAAGVREGGSLRAAFRPATLRHHASLVDLRSHSQQQSASSRQSQATSPDPPNGGISRLNFGKASAKVRARAGT